MKTYRQFILENELLIEHILSIGLNPDHETHRETHRQAIHDMLRDSYANIGGYGGMPSGTKEESDAIHDDISKHLMKVTTREGKPTAIALYKNQHGRKVIAIGSDGTRQGKMDVKKTVLSDKEQKRAWGEVSGAAEMVVRRAGFPKIDPSKAPELTGKSDVRPDPDDPDRYIRKIGTVDKSKILMGYPKR